MRTDKQNIPNYDPINVYIRDTANTIIASGAYTNPGSYSFTFTPSSSSSDYTLEYYVVDASGLCNFRVDNISISSPSTTYITVCDTLHAGDYRYSFQGQEHDDEIKGKGNSINYTYRMHDPRLGRFFAVDPLASKYPHYTPYSFSGNKVIHAIELEGLEELVVSTLRNSSTPALYVFSDSRLQNEIMFIVPGISPGYVNTITRPITKNEKEKYNTQLMRQGSKPGLRPVDTQTPSYFLDSYGQKITQNLIKDAGTVQNPITDPANMTMTTLQGDFGNNSSGVFEFDVQIARGATSLQIDYSSAGNMNTKDAPWVNSFTIQDATTGAILGTFSPTRTETNGSISITIDPTITNLKIKIEGSANQSEDAFYLGVTSSGPDSSASNVEAVNSKNQKTTPITVKSSQVSSTKSINM